MIKNIMGDLLSDAVIQNTDMIVHQVNCKGVMGAGLAAQIRKKYPPVYTAYTCYCRRFSPQELLGTYLAANRYGDFTINRLPERIQPLVINAFGQDGYGRQEMQTSYHALEIIFRNLRDEMHKKGYHSIAVPKNLGCGLAGGNWNTIYGILADIFLDDPDITLLIVQR